MLAIGVAGALRRTGQWLRTEEWMDLVSLDTAPEGLTQWVFDGEPRSTVGSSAFRRALLACLGIHCVARRALLPGDPVLLEPPLVSTRTATVDGLPSAEPEWMLVHALLTSGKRRRWALQYASLAGAAPSGLEAVCSWLSEAHGVAADEPALLWQAVRGNAFGLETPLLGVESGGKPGEWPPLGSATARDPGRLWMARRRVWAALLTPEDSCCRGKVHEHVAWPRQGCWSRLADGAGTVQDSSRGHAPSTTRARPTATRCGWAATWPSSPRAPSGRAKS